MSSVSSGDNLSADVELSLVLLVLFPDLTLSLHPALSTSVWLLVPKNPSHCEISLSLPDSCTQTPTDPAPHWNRAQIANNLNSKPTKTSYIHPTFCMCLCSLVTYSRVVTLQSSSFRVAQRTCTPEFPSLLLPKLQ